ncbi:VC0807 family protein [Clostridium ljungdahlii]|uniref:Putative membrane protein n=1 Tax=Clostridium ljungdahlii (strain ATCC 55383 / DSM 13528 / PETC) TaxID=748727 RepID=D8GTM1_CLOLD|nr:VC0807 family protein [Clostridium ljungdahlii]ADK14670.1 putative membrane protein [Clostridium ljungdahlii DSM 13528]OAA85907.1 hypothetical protein WX45_00112 [Clostridium ljungdahlii DSM 13528]
MEKSYANGVKNKSSILRNILNKDFVVSAIIPVVIFYVFDKFKMTLSGIIFSGLWSIGVVIANFIKTREINALAVMAAAFSGIGLVGSVISKNATFYFVSPLVGNALVSLLFFLSLLSRKSLIEVIVEQSYLKNAPEKMKNDKDHKFVWRFLSAIWGFGNLSQVILGVVLLKVASMSLYYAVINIYGNILSILLLAFSITFPKIYFKKKSQKIKN